MADANDIALLQEFAGHNSEAAFAELVRRYINLVYSVALRFTGNTGDAEDVAQAVFIILARKARRLSGRTVLTGWLYETTRFTAMRLLRTQARRRAREQEASMQFTLDEPGADDVWRQLAPHLEAAMSRLGERDRTLLALRYYENKTGAEAAVLLGISEEAARKRTNRALEKLRNAFAKRGISSTTAVIAETISAHSVQAAPAVLAKTVTAVAVAKGAAASTSTLILIEGALKIMAWTKAKTAIVVGVIAVLAATSTTVIGTRLARAHHAATEPGAGLSPTIVTATFDIQPDGSVLFQGKVEETNSTSRTISSTTITGPDEIHRVTDESGKPMSITKRPGGGVFVTMNQAVPPGGRTSYTAEGRTVPGLVKENDAGEYVLESGTAIGNVTEAYVVVVWRLPKGATLLGKNSDMQATTNAGQIELRMDKIVPPNSGFPIGFRYRLGPAANGR